MMNSNVIGTVYQLPDDKKNFASGRGAIYTLGSYAPTIITMGGGGNKPHIVIKENHSEQPS